MRNTLKNVQLALTSLLLLVGLTGCTTNFDVAAKTACETHEDCVALNAVCLFESSDDPLGVCVAEGATIGADAGPGTDAGPDTGLSCPGAECVLGVSECVGDTQLAACVDDGSGCGELATPVDCPPGGTCAAARCIQPDMCRDEDGDGFGDNCPAGEDCDDGDPDFNPGAPERCDDRDWDCNGDPRAGIDFNDVNQCGSCDNVCTGKRASWRCDGGECVVARCDAGYSDENGVATDGCEAQCVSTLTREVECSDGVDDDCDGLVDVDDNDCIVSRIIAGTYSGYLLHREDLTTDAGSEISMVVDAVEASVNDEAFTQTTRFRGTPLLPFGGEQLDTLEQKRLVVQGAGRYSLTGSEAGGGPDLYRVFASRDAVGSVLLGVRLDGDPMSSSVWHDGMLVMGRRAAIAEAAFTGAYLGASYRARTSASDVRTLSQHSTWVGQFNMRTAGGGRSELLHEYGASGEPDDASLYPLELDLAYISQNAFSLKRLRSMGSWDVGYHGAIYMGGSLGIFGLYNPIVCDDVEFASASCPPEAGLTALVQSPSATIHTLSGRWALVGIWHQDDSSVDTVKGAPLFLGVEVEIDAGFSVLGSGFSEQLGEIGQGSQVDATVALELSGIKNNNPVAPDSLSLSGFLSTDGKFAILVPGGRMAPGDGVYVLMRL